MTFFKRACSILLAVALIVTVFAVAIYTGTSAATLEVEEQYGLTVSSKGINEGGDAVVNVTLSGSDVYGTQFVAKYDSTVLEKPTVALLGAMASDTSYKLEKNTDVAGQVIVVIYYLKGAEAVKAIPEGQIVSLTFKAKTIGDNTFSKVELEDTVLAGSDGNDIPEENVTVSNGEVAVFPTGAPILTYAQYNLYLESNMRFMWYVAKTMENDYTDMYSVFTLDGKDTTVQPVDSGSYYVFNFANIDPLSYAKKIKVSLYGKRNGKWYKSTEKSKSIVDFCYESYSRDNTDRPYNTLIADMLNYGADVQRYYKANGNEVGPICTEDARIKDYVAQHETKTDVTPVDGSDVKYKECEGRTLWFSAMNLYLESSVSVTYIFRTEESFDDIEIRAYDIDETTLLKTFTKKDFVHYGDYNGKDCYKIVFDGYDIDEMQKPVLMVAYKGDEIISRTVKYTIESYAYSAVNGKYKDEMKTACKSMVKFGRSAATYLNSK